MKKNKIKNTVCILLLAVFLIGFENTILATGASLEADVSASNMLEIASPVTVALCGDVLIDRGVKKRLYDSGNDGVLPQPYAQPLIDANITVLNLELPFSRRGAPIPDKTFTFRGDPEQAGFLTDIGTDIVTLANNHILDYGTDAFMDTLDVLNAKGIKYIGAGRDLEDAKRYEIIEVSGKKIAFLAASRVIPYVSWHAANNKPGVFSTYNPAALNEQIKQAAQEADYVIVYVHWGVERNTLPEQYQVSMAHGYIDSGADAVIGSHPHVLQGFELYKGKPIAYSLGNFIFTDAKKDTVAVTLTFNEGEMPIMHLIPYQINNLTTTFMEDVYQRQQLKTHLEKISFDIYIDQDWAICPVK